MHSSVVCVTPPPLPLRTSESKDELLSKYVAILAVILMIVNVWITLQSSRHYEDEVQTTSLRWTGQDGSLELFVLYFISSECGANTG